MESMKITEENVMPFPVGSLISSRLPSHAVGDLLQVHEFLFRFQEVLGLKEPLSVEELETEFLCSWPDCLGSLEDCTHGLAKSSILGDKLTVVYRTLLPELVSKLLDGIDSAVDLKLVTLPVNKLTWPEVARRYIMAYALLSSSGNSNNDSKLIRCLHGDGGIYCGSSSVGVAGVELDARLLGRAVDNVFGKLKNERSILSLRRSDVVTTNVGSFPEWAKELVAVRKLPTNVGSRIRQCVHEALKKNPPEWAKEQLEASIAKDVYKGNASGPTKSAVKAVLDRAESDVAQRLLPQPNREDVRRRRPELLSRVIMKKCYYVLGSVVATHKNKDQFSDLVGMDYISNVNDLSSLLGSASTRPLDLQTINFRLLHGTYGASHEAFLEDARDVKDSLKLWIDLKKISGSITRLVKLDKMSKNFELLYKKEVATLSNRFPEYEFTAEVEQELEEILKSVEIPQKPLKSVICEVCGINIYGNRLVFCATNGCTSAYHKFCLDPPLSCFPKKDWHCPTCARPIEPPGTPQILQFVDRSWKEGSELLDIVIALGETEYSEFEPDKKIVLLKHLCEELLETSLIRRDVKKCTTKQAKTLLGIDSAGSMYWGLPNASTPYGIVVNGNIPLENNTQSNPNDSGTWSLFHSDEEINNLVNYLTIIDPEKTELIDSVLMWHQSITQGDEQTKMNPGERSTVYSTLLKKSPNFLATNATALLEATFGEPDEAVTYVMKSGRKSMAKWNRCNCLEPIFHSRYHCARCHETFFTNIKFQQHITGTCSLYLLVAKEPPADWLKEINFPVPESSLKPLIGKSLHILRQLKINLLDMEAALPVRAKRSSRASPEWRSAWCAFVKTADTIYEMVEATLVLETMIKTEYIKNTWWWYWSSISAALKTSTLSALALRIYTLDANIDYQKTSSSTDQKQPRKMRKTSEKAKEKSKIAKDPEEKINNKDVVVAWDTTQ